MGKSGRSSAIVDRRHRNRITISIGQTREDFVRYVSSFINEELKTILCNSSFKATTSNGFAVWDFNEENRISDDCIVLQLPYGIRNITTKMLQSNSIMLSSHKNYAIAGVR